MSGIDFEQIIQHQQQHNDKHLESEDAEIILEDLSCIKCHPQNPTSILVFKGF